MSVTIYDRTGLHVVARSKNLRAIIRHAGKHGINVARLYPVGSEGFPYRVKFWFCNGDYAETRWNDWRVLVDWLSAGRVRTPNRLTLPEILWHDANDSGRLAALRERGSVVTMNDHAA